MVVIVVTKAVMDSEKIKRDVERLETITMLDAFDT